MTKISGQKPVITKARKAIAGFKIREGYPIGCMKVLASVKKICRNCKIIRRKGVVRVICTADARHKQRQG